MKSERDEKRDRTVWGLWLNGQSCSVIGKQFGITHSRVNQLLFRYKRRFHSWVDINGEQWIATMNWGTPRDYRVRQ